MVPCPQKEKKAICIILFFMLLWSRSLTPTASHGLLLLSFLPFQIFTGKEPYLFWILSQIPSPPPTFPHLIINRESFWSKPHCENKGQDAGYTLAALASTAYLLPSYGMCCERNDTKTKHTRHTRDRPFTLRPEEQNCENNLRFIIINPLGRIPGCMNKPFQYSAGAYMLSYSKGSEIPVYCRVCPGPFFFCLSQEGNAPSFLRDH